MKGSRVKVKGGERGTGHTRESLQNREVYKKVQGAKVYKGTGEPNGATRPTRVSEGRWKARGDRQRRRSDGEEGFEAACTGKQLT